MTMKTTTETGYDIGYERGMKKGMEIIILSLKKIMEDVKEKPANMIMDLLNKFIEDASNGIE